MAGSAAIQRRNALGRPPADPIFLGCRPGPIVGAADTVEYCLVDALGAVLLHCAIEWRVSVDTVSGFEGSCLEARAVMTLLKAQVRRRDVVLDDVTDNPHRFPLEFLAAANSVSQIDDLARQPRPMLWRARPESDQREPPTYPASPALDSCLRQRRLWMRIEGVRDGAEPGRGPVLSQIPRGRLQWLFEAGVLTAAMAGLVFASLGVFMLAAAAWRALHTGVF